MYNLGCEKDRISGTVAAQLAKLTGDRKKPLHFGVCRGRKTLLRDGKCITHSPPGLTDFVQGFSIGI